MWEFPGAEAGNNSVRCKKSCRPDYTVTITEDRYVMVGYFRRQASDLFLSDAFITVACVSDRNSQPSCR